MKHLTAQPVVDELPAPFPNVIRKALAKDPKDRYQTVGEMMADVFAVQDVSQWVESIDSLSLTRMAAAVSQKVKSAPVAAVGGGIATGSSNLTAFARTPPPPPPPVIERSGGLKDMGRQMWDDAWKPDTKWKTGTPPFPQRYRLTTGLLGVFFGWLGIHRFYTGYTAIGVFQMIVTFLSGVGALWGWIDGILILLNGNYVDAAARPLLESQWKTRPGGRSPAARTIWGFFAFAFSVGAIATFCGGTFADVEMARCGFSLDGQTYYWNEMHALYFFSAGMLAFASFALWKASHRGGLMPWRATIRPALMCVALAFGLASFNAYLNLAAGQLQLVFLGFSAFMCLVFAQLWVLRGPPVPLMPGDAYWNRMWAKTFTYVFIASAIVASSMFSKWAKSNFKLETNEPEFRTFALERREWPDTSARNRRSTRSDVSEFSEDGTVSDADGRIGAVVDEAVDGAVQMAERVHVLAQGRTPSDSQIVRREYRVAGRQYSQWPLATVFAGLMAFCSANEASNRRRQARRAMEELKESAE